MSAFYWERHPDGPFATLIAVAATYCSPDAYDGAYADLVDRARAQEAADDEMRAFKDELRQALTDPSQLPENELDDAVEYDDGTDEKFLRRLWRRNLRRRACHWSVSDCRDGATVMIGDQAEAKK